MSDDFAISIGKDDVEVRLQPSARSPHGKLGGAIGAAGVIAVVSCASLFLPGKHGNPSMWRDMSNASIESGRFWVPLMILAPIDALLAWLSFRWGAAAWPSDESLHCDRVTLTISRVPYFDFSNRTWKMNSYALRGIEKFRFAVYASAKGMSIYGFLFNENGTEHKILPGLEAPEAQSILRALQSFGVAVVLDDKLQKRVDEALEQRGNQVTQGL